MAFGNLLQFAHRGCLSSFFHYGKIVIVEADNEDLAVEEALKIGLYFDGVRKGIDRECIVTGKQIGRAHV